MTRKQDGGYNQCISISYQKFGMQVMLVFTNIKTTFIAEEAKSSKASTAMVAWLTSCMGNMYISQGNTYLPGQLYVLP